MLVIMIVLLFYIMRKLSIVEEKQFNRKILIYTPFLEAFALKLTADSEKANDLFKETICRAITFRNKFHSGNLKAWLATIMRNLFINGTREKKRWQMTSNNGENDYMLESNSIPARNLGDSTIMMKELKKEIDLLHPNLKKPFFMRYYGYRYQEIADEMTVPLGTIKSRVHIARKQLTRKLSKMYGSHHLADLAA